MEFLKAPHLLFVLLFFASGSSFAESEPSSPPTIPCRSTNEFISTYDHLLKSKKVLVTESAARAVAQEVAAGCNGASERFTESLELFKEVGASDVSSLKLALESAKMSDNESKTFLRIFKIVYDSKLFQLNFQAAYKLAVLYSRQYKGNLTNIRKDFTGLSYHCLQEKDLPRGFCAEWILNLADSSHLFPNGVFESFNKLNLELKKLNSLNLSPQDNLNLCAKILKFGPEAPENFLSAFEYAHSQPTLKFTNQKSLEFALKMASLSMPSTKNSSSNARVGP